MFYKKKLFYIILPFLLAGAGLIFVFGVQASTVYSLTATTHTVCESGCDFCTIQAAINGAAPGDTLNLAGEIFTEPFTVDKPLIIEGASAQTTILQAAAAPGIATSRVVMISEGVTATITGVTIRYGNISGLYPEGYGGGIFNDGTLTLDSSSVMSNNAGEGGGIFTDSVLTVTNSIVMSNTTESGNGGGIYNDSGLEKYNAATVVNSTFVGNVASSEYGGGSGGGIYTTNYTNLRVSGSTFEGNTAHGSGGGIYAYRYADTEIFDCIFSNNRADFRGGAIRNDSFSPLLIWDSVFHDNSAESGGAIYASFSLNQEIVRSEFLTNTASSFGGAIYNTEAELRIIESYFAENQADSFGGAVYNSVIAMLKLPVRISDTTFYSNSSGYVAGAIYNSADGKSIITRSTFESNHAQNYGGAIYNNYGGEVDLSNSTLSGNTTDGSGGGLFLNNAATLTATNVSISNNSAIDNGGGIYVTGYGKLYLDSSLVASSLSGSDCAYRTGDPWGTVIDLGHNLVEDGTCIYDPTSFSAPPLLGTLQDNGGKTETHALLEGSPAIDVIPTGACQVIEDQRSISRPQGVACDIGAFELGSSYSIFLPLVLNEYSLVPFRPTPR